MTVFSRGFVDSTGTEIPDLSPLKGDLTREQEVAFFERWKANPSDRVALEKLQSVCVIYIDFEAKKRKGYGIPAFDLIQEGFIGFMQALKKYDPNHDSQTRLASFAIFDIKHCMNEYVIRNTKALKTATTKDQRKLFFNFRQVTYDMHGDRKSLTEEQIDYVAKKLSVSVKSVKQMQSRLSPQSYVSTTSVHDFGKAEGSSEHILEENDEEVKRALFLDAINRIDERKKDILLKRHPNDGKKATLGDLADYYGVSAERIRQLEKDAIKEVKSIISQSGYESVSTLSPDSEFVIVHSNLTAR